MKRLTAILALTLVLTTATAQAAKVFYGASFTVAYPDSLIAIGSLPNATDDGFDSAFFRDPHGRVEFYVYSPQAGGEPADLKRLLAGEKLLAKTEAQGSERNARWTTYAAADGSYLRSVEELRTPDLLQVRVFAVKYRTIADLAAFRADYETFKKSFEALPDRQPARRRRARGR